MRDLLPTWTIILVDANNESQYQKRFKGDYLQVLEKAKELLEFYKGILNVTDYQIGQKT